MTHCNSLNGQELRDMFVTATAWLEKNAPDIDALNVFPVPDGDCGTNMLLTMRSSIEEAYRAPDRSASAVAQAMARGALMGARGNSGVILSQIWRGIAESMDDKETIDASDLAEALTRASKTAFEALSNPVEGTILTVVREAAAAGRAQAARKNNDLVSVLEATLQAAGESVANTPSLLPALKEAGVVDAGGQGLHTLLDGALRYLKGEGETMQFRKPMMITSNIPLTPRVQSQAADEEPYGYCTEFMIKGEKLKPKKLRAKLTKKGQSLIVVGDKVTIRVHIHTLDPGEIISYATTIGTLHQVSIRNMDEQHQAYLEMQKSRMPIVDIATVAVVPGDGLIDVFSSLGVTAVVSGGQTMNPSTKELLRAVESVGSDKVIILPNNKNIIPAASQVQSLTKKKVAVVPTETIPQGVAALLSFDYEAEFDANAQIMNQARSAVRTVEITRAVRATQLGRLKIKKGQSIGFLEGDLVAVNNTAPGVLNKVFEKLELSKAEVITIYYGADAEQAEAEKVRAGILEQHPHLQIEVLKGGQPHYDYILSIE